jgi:hypothetical protein
VSGVHTSLINALITIRELGRLPDAGVERLGYGEVMLRIEVVPRRQ